MKIAVIAGAGASYAVSSENYPTTRGFFERLPATIRDDRIFKMVCGFLERRTPDITIDIELVLWELRNISNFCNLASRPDDIINWLIFQKQLNSLSTRSNQNIGQLPGMLKQIAPEVERLRDGINENVFGLYGIQPEAKDLRRNWTRLFRLVSHSSPHRLEIFTTNYDQVIETALDLLPESFSDVELGWRGRVQRKIDPTVWGENTQPFSNAIKLTKLHGSVDWSKVEQEIHVGGDPGFKGEHSRHAIIYPGFKGEPAQPLFRTFHHYFERTLRACDALLIIGFAFRDESINQRIASSLDPSSRAVAIDPSPGLLFPGRERNFTHLQQGFAAKSLTDAFAKLKKQ